MIVDELKAKAALASTYARGLDLVRRGHVVNCEVEHAFDGYIDLEGTVVGSTGATYNASVTFSSMDALVIDHSCTCPAYDSYGGMCKHSIALALKYLDSIGEVQIPQMPAVRTGANASGQKKGAAPYEYTSPQVEKLVARYAGVAQRAARQIADSQPQRQEAEPADLVCVFQKGADPRSYYDQDDGMFSLGLKIVRGKTSYVVKRISDLVEAWQAGAVFTYGKNLSFAHRKSAFTDSANALLAFLEPLVNAQLSLYAAQQSRSYYQNPSFSTKTLPLASDQMAEVLDMMMGRKVVYEESSYNYYSGRSKQKSTLTVREGNPKLEVVIAKSEAGDYDLGVYPGEVECVVGKDSLYLLTGKYACRVSDEFAAKLGIFCESVLPCKNVMHIRAQDMPGFCSAVLPALREFCDVTEPDDLDDQLPPAPEFVFRVGVHDGYVICQTQVDYGDESINLLDAARDDQVSRDVPREVAVQQAVKQFFPEGRYDFPDFAHPISRYSPYARYRESGSFRHQGAPGGEPAAPCFPEDDDAAYYLLLADGLRELSGFGEVMLSDRLRNAAVRPAPSVSVQAGANVKSGLLDIKVTATDMTPAELMAYLASYQRKQRYVRLSDGDIVRLDGSVQALSDLANGLGVEAADLVEGTREVSMNRMLFVDAMLKRAPGVRFNRNAAFRKVVREFETIEDADFEVPAELESVLRPYQKEGYKWLRTLGKFRFGGILADDMGLGKTLQFIAYALACKLDGEELPVLVVCPASLVYNWISEFSRFAPELEVAAVAGQKKARMSQVASADDYDVLVTSYDLMKRDVDAYEQREFSCVVLDEAQYIKNSQTKAAKAAKRLKSRVRFALTGTPIENRLAELWSIFDFLMPGVLGSADSFDKRFSQPIVDGDEAVARQLQSLVSPFILRRLKGDVLDDLPDKEESIVYAQMEGEQLKLYRSNAEKLSLLLQDQMPEEFAGMKLKVLAELTKLRQLCCDPSLLYDDYKGASAKLDTCIELLGSAIDGGHSVLLFSQFTSMLDIIAARLDAEKVSYFMLTGSTSKEQRARLVKRFQEGEAPVFLISLKAGGVGLNLTAADIVIHYDPWWNLAAQNQATDRAHRIGQTRDVSVFRLIAKDTIEEKIVDMQNQKHDLAESVVGGEALSQSSLTRESVLALLGGM